MKIFTQFIFDQSTQNLSNYCNLNRNIVIARWSFFSIIKKYSVESLKEDCCLGILDGNHIFDPNVHACGK